MSTTYYVVKEGHQTGIFTSASEAISQIDGHPQAFVKTFTDQSAAEEFLNASPDSEANQHIIAYVDGSFDTKTKRYSSGIVLLDGQKIVDEFSHVYNDQKYNESHQIAGEVFGAAHAIQRAIQRGYQRITIYYDYLGIEKWATGEWRANKPVSKDYIKFIEKVKPLIDIDFKKVKAHSGEEYNERADQLAKQALAD